MSDQEQKQLPVKIYNIKTRYVKKDGTVSEYQAQVRRPVSNGKRGRKTLEFKAKLRSALAQLTEAQCKEIYETYCVEKPDSTRESLLDKFPDQTEDPDSDIEEL